ncbi:methyltransferase domain-containing protein [Rhodospirillaceae bacterium]|nr:methyltransferase domain-containing protein [Rhodospirillaceae bacterium]
MINKYKVSASRSVAFDLLRSVTAKNKSFDDAMVLHDGFRRLPLRDRAFVRKIVTTALRRLGQIDALISHCLKRDLPTKAIVVHDILRIAVTEIIFLKFPPHAAVDSAVTLVGSRNFPKLMGLTNAVLRRLVTEGQELLNRFPEALNIPKWMLESWKRAYGDTDTQEIIVSLLREPSLDITVKNNKEFWADKLDADVLSLGSLRKRFDGRIEEMPGFAEGEWWVQDAAAAIPVSLLGDVSGMQILDICAAPGGKTAQLAAAGAIVTAIDRSSGRLKRLEKNLIRLGLQANIVTADVTEWVCNKKFDAVLLDPPCSATGTIRRHPDILYSKTTNDLAKLVRLQESLLVRSSQLVKPGGKLIFCTCSLEVEEGESQIERFLSTSNSFKRQTIKDNEVGGHSPFINEQGDLRTLPFYLKEVGGIDGFFASRLICE